MLPFYRLIGLFFLRGILKRHPLGPWACLRGRQPLLDSHYCGGKQSVCWGVHPRLQTEGGLLRHPSGAGLGWANTHLPSPRVSAILPGARTASGGPQKLARDKAVRTLCHRTRLELGLPPERISPRWRRHLVVKAGSTRVRPLPSSCGAAPNTHGKSGGQGLSHRLQDPR